MAEQESRREEEVDLLDLLLVLAKRKKLILGITLGAAVLTAIISLLLPPIYKAETKILAPQQGSSGMTSQFLSQLGGAAGLLGVALPVKTPNELYIDMLKSRTVLDRIIDRFHLMKAYKKKYREDARKNLLQALNAQEQKRSGIVSVLVEDRDPQKAADMANAFVEELKALSGGLAVTEAAQRRLFFEEQLKGTKVALVMAEEAIKGFQEKTGALQIDSQAKAMIEGIANLKAMIAAKEVQLKVLRSYATLQNPDLQKIEEELRGLKAEMSKLEAGGEGGYSTLMPTGRMPEVGTGYYRRLRDLKFNETLYELLAKQYEMAKLDEARDAAIIQVIDLAVPPERRVRPRRTLMVLVASITALFLSTFFAIFLGILEKSAEDPVKSCKLQALKGQWGEFFKGSGKGRKQT